MKPFLCLCGNTLYFDNTRCLECQREIGYDSVDDQMVEVGHDKAHVRCANGAAYGACNWAVPVAEQGTLCPACLLTTTIPDLSTARAKELWAIMEQAKRNVVYSLIRLDLPVVNRRREPNGGLEFKFLLPINGKPVITEHEKGMIAINLEEADDAIRERNRTNLHEPYRTLSGHLRHELGHYYWYRWFETRQLVPGAIEACREIFGDERQDYAAAMKKHYDHGAPAGWQNSFISSYSTMHPWEDWAETWAQYLHICDGLETAHTFGLEQGVKGKQIDLYTAEAASLPAPFNKLDAGPFLKLLHRWVRLSPALNAIGQSLGHRNMYPFVLSTPVVRKLHFIHACIENPPVVSIVPGAKPTKVRKWFENLFGAHAAA